MTGAADKPRQARAGVGGKPPRYGTGSAGGTAPLPPLAAHDPRVLWQKQRRGQIAQAASARGMALLPIGAVEQHGPHLPLDTDCYTAFEICARAAERVEAFPVLVLPPIWWGLSPYWMRLPGTITIRPEILMGLVVDVCGSVGRHGFRKILVVNGHGGNSGLLEATAATCSTPALRVATISYWSLVPDVMQRVSERDGGRIGHAGELETSVQLHLQPSLVDLDAVSSEQCTPLASRPNPAYSPPDVGPDASRTVFGQALAGRADKGEAIVCAAVAALASFIESFGADQAPAEPLL
ncbi:MAG: creatininase family protein [Chloroflexota bacterium]